MRDKKLRQELINSGILFDSGDNDIGCGLYVGHVLKNIMNYDYGTKRQDLSFNIPEAIKDLNLQVQRQEKIIKILLDRLELKIHEIKSDTILVKKVEK